MISIRYFILLLLPFVVKGQAKFEPLKKELVANKTYEYVYNFENNYAAVRTFKGKMGLIDTTGKVIIKPVYPYINNNGDLKNLYEVASVSNKKFKRGYIDLKENIKIPLEYDDVFYLGKGLIRVSKNNKTGVLDTLNQIILPLKFDFIMQYEGIIFTETNNTLDIFDSTGKQLTNFKAKDITYFTNNKAIVTRQDNKSFIIDNQGRIVLNAIANHRFEKIIDSDSYLIQNTATKKKGVINASGKYEIECKYDDILTEKLVYIVVNKLKYGLITPNDSILKPLIYDGIQLVNYKDDNLFQNQFLAKKGKLEGIINPFTEKEIVPIQYQDVQTFSNYFVVTNAENKNGLFSEKGENIINEEYQFYNLFQDKIFATKKNKNYLITLSANQYAEVEIPVDEFVNDGQTFSLISHSKYQVFKKGNKMGVISNENKIVIPAEFEAITSISNGEFIVRKDNKYGIVNSQSQVVLAIKYDSYAVMKEYILFQIKNSKDEKYSYRSQATEE